MTLKEICKMLIHMRHPEVYHHLGIVPSWSSLFMGHQAVGRLYLHMQLLGELDLPILKVAAQRLCLEYPESLSRS